MAGEEKNKVLYVEDESAFYKLVSAQLEAKGFEVLWAKTGEEGVGLTKTVQPSVILIDIMLPGIDGWKVLEAIRQDEHAKHVPVIMLTSLQAQKPPDDPVSKTTIYLEKAKTNLADVARIVGEAVDVYRFYLEAGLKDWDMVAMTDKIKEHAGIVQ